MKKDDGRMQAYGWSLPAKFQPQIPNAAATRSSVSVPVPVYCRPLLEAEQGLKVSQSFTTTFDIMALKYKEKTY